MKQPKKLPLKYKKIVSRAGLRAENWMLQKDEPGYIVVVSKHSSRTKVIEKER